MNKFLKILFSFTIFSILLSATTSLNIFAQEATNSSDTIREKVKEKLNRAMNKPKAYIGTITDLTDSTIQINNLEGEIQQIAILQDQTTFANVKDNEQIEYSDIAIGDQIVAVGFLDENKTLESLRILVTSTEESTGRAIYYAKVVTIENKSIILNDSEKGEVELTFPRMWKGPEIYEFEEGQRVAAVSVNNDGVLTIRTIEIVDQNTQQPSPNE